MALLLWWTGPGRGGVVRLDGRRGGSLFGLCGGCGAGRQLFAVIGDQLVRRDRGVVPHGFGLIIGNDFFKVLVPVKPAQSCYRNLPAMRQVNRLRLCRIMPEHAACGQAGQQAPAARKGAYGGGRGGRDLCCHASGCLFASLGIVLAVIIKDQEAGATELGQTIMLAEQEATRIQRAKRAFCPDP